MKVAGGGAVGVAALAIAAAAALAGCGGAGTGRPPAKGTVRPVAAPLSASLSGTGTTWAVVPVSAASGRYWELLVERDGASRWSLATPPGVADNGGLVVGSRGGNSLVAGFRPSEDMVFSPLAATADAGVTWSPGLLDAGLASLPDALAAAPDGRLLALLGGGQARLSAPGGRRWVRLASAGSLASGVAGRPCGLAGLTAAAFTPAGTPLLGGACTRGQAAGIFAYRGGRWQAAGPRLPASLAAGGVQVLRLTAAGGSDLALLAAGRPPAVSLLAAWTTGGGRWTLSAPLRLPGSRVDSVALGPGGSVAVVLPGGRAAALSGIGAGWRQLPALPARTAGLAVGARGRLDAIATHGTQLTVWRLIPRPGSWARVQALAVPVH